MKQEEKINVYYGVTNYHVLCCILHSLKYNNGKNNVIYISNWHPDHLELSLNLKKMKLFSRVEIFEETLFPSGNKKIDIKQMDEDIEYINNHIPKKFVDDIKKSNEIYIAGDYYCCSIFLTVNKIKYNYIEEACGVLSDEERLMKNIRSIDYSRYQIMKKLKLPGNHTYIIKRFGDLNHQLDGYLNKKDVHFSVDEILKEFDFSTVSKIVMVFSDEKFTIKNNSVLLLTFHYVNMKLLKMNEQRLLYSYLIDYFGDDKNIIIKQHPSDIQPNYYEWFPNATILPRKLPSELLPFLSKSKYYRIMTAYSTSIFSMQSYCNDIISFNSTIEQSFKLMDSYYFILKILNELKLKKYKIFGISINESIIKNFVYIFGMKYFDISFVNSLDDIKYNDKKIVIVDDFSKISKKKLLNDDIVFVSDVYTTNKNEELTMMFLEKQILDKDKYFDFSLIKNQVLGLYCNDENIVKSIKKLKINKTMKTTNVEINLGFDTAHYLFNNNLLINTLYSKFEQENNSIELQLKEINNKVNILNNELNISEEKYIKALEEGKFYKNKYDEVISSSSWKITAIYRKFGYIIKKIFRR